MDRKHVQADIQLLSKTFLYIQDGTMDAYFMLLSFCTIFQLIFGQGGKLNEFLTKLLDHIFSNCVLYIIQ